MLIIFKLRFRDRTVLSKTMFVLLGTGTIAKVAVKESHVILNLKCIDNVFDNRYQNSGIRPRRCTKLMAGRPPRMLNMWSSKLSTHTTFNHELQKIISEVRVPVRRTCRTGCFVSICPRHQAATRPRKWRISPFVSSWGGDSFVLATRQTVPATR